MTNPLMHHTPAPRPGYSPGRALLFSPSFPLPFRPPLPPGEGWGEGSMASLPPRHGFPTPPPLHLLTSSPPHPKPHNTRRASAAVAMIIVLVILQLAVVAAISGAGRATGPGDLAAARLDAARAFYAVEAGMNMALREVMLAADEDGDGVIGGISDDAIDSTDPDLGHGARVRVTRSQPEPGLLLLTSRARSGEARRAIQATLE